MNEHSRLAFLAALREEFGDRPFTAATILDSSIPFRSLPLSAQTASRRGTPMIKALGATLRHVDGLVRVGRIHSGTVWMVKA